MTAPRRFSMGIRRGAVFLDRDGTLIVDRHYLRDPALVELLPDVAHAVRFLNNVVLPVVVVTNQSGIARGLLSEQDYAAVHGRLEDLLSERGAYIDAVYHCPHLPELSGPCTCRKPGTSLFERAIRELALDAKSCVYIGDRWRDIVAAKALGGRGILVPSAETPPAEIAQAEAELETALTLADAVRSCVATTTPPLGAPPGS